MTLCGLEVGITSAVAVSADRWVRRDMSVPRSAANLHRGCEYGNLRQLALGSSCTSLDRARAVRHACCTQGATLGV